MTTVAYKFGDEPATYALEGTIHACIIWIFFLMFPELSRERGCGGGRYEMAEG